MRPQRHSVTAGAKRPSEAEPIQTGTVGRPRKYGGTGKIRLCRLCEKPRVIPKGEPAGVCVECRTLVAMAVDESLARRYRETGEDIRLELHPEELERLREIVPLWRSSGNGAVV